MRPFTYMDGVVVCLCLALGTPCAMGEYEFTGLVDNTTGEFAEFYAGAALNNAGVVAFRADHDGAPGVFTAGLGGYETVASSMYGHVYGLWGFGMPSINDSGAVAFTAYSYYDYGQGVYVVAGGLTPIYQASDAGLTGPDINSNGLVAFQTRNYDTGESTIYAGNGHDPLVTIASSDATYGFAALQEEVSINADGTVAFKGTRISGPNTICTGSGGSGTVAPIVDDSGRYGVLGNPSVNDQGTVAFTGYDRYSGLLGIFTGMSALPGEPTALVTSEGEFNWTSDPALNAGGQIAFQAWLDSGSSGIYVGADPVADKVIQLGDSLFGSTVVELDWHRQGFNDSRQIAFRYVLDDGKAGIALASPGGQGDGNTFDWNAYGPWPGASINSPGNWEPHQDAGPQPGDTVRFDLARCDDPGATAYLEWAAQHGRMVIQGDVGEDWRSLTFDLRGNTCTLGEALNVNVTSSYSGGASGTVNFDNGALVAGQINVSAGRLQVWEGIALAVGGELKVADATNTSRAEVSIWGPLTAGAVTVGDANCWYNPYANSHSGRLELRGNATVAGDVTVYSLLEASHYDPAPPVTLTARNVLLRNGGRLSTYGDVVVNADLDMDPWGSAGLWVRGGSTTINGAVTVGGEAITDTLTGGNWETWDGGQLILAGVGDITSSSASVRLDGLGVSFSNIANLQENRGWFCVENDGRFTTAGDFVNTGTIVVWNGIYTGGQGTEMTVSGDLTNSGTLRMYKGQAGVSKLTVGASGPTGTLRNTGEIWVEGGSLAAGTVLLDGGRLHGTGVVEAHVVNAGGAIAPDAAQTLTVLGSLTQLLGGTMGFTIGNAGAGVLDIPNGQVSIRGSLFAEWTTDDVAPSTTLITFGDPGADIRFSSFRTRGLAPGQAMCGVQTANSYEVRLLQKEEAWFQSNFAAALSLAEALPPGSSWSPQDDLNGVAVELVDDEGARVVQMRDGRDDGSADVWLSIPLDLETHYLNVHLAYRFRSWDGQLKVLLDDQVVQVLALDYGVNYTAYDVYDATFDLAEMGITGPVQFTLKLVNPGGDPIVNIKDVSFSRVIPEPASLALLAIGGLGVLYRRRRLQPRRRPSVLPQGRPRPGPPDASSGLSVGPDCLPSQWP